MSRLSLLVAGPVGARAQTVVVNPAVHVDDGTLRPDPRYARAPVTDGVAEVEWQGWTEPVRLGVDSVTATVRVLPDGEAVAPLNDRVRRALVAVDGLGTVEVRAFPPRWGAVLYRLADLRLGTVRVGNREVPFALERGLGRPQYDGTAELFVDLDGDGRFRPSAALDADGTLLDREGGAITAPRLVDGVPVEADSLAADGSAVRFRLGGWTVAPHPGFLAPEAAFPTLAGDTLRLADLRGRTVVLSWWATTCPYCAEERPMLNALAEAVANDPDVVWLAPALDDDPATVEQFLAERPYAPEVTLLPDATEAAFEAVVFPRHTVIAPDGTVVFDERGATDDREATLRAALAAARAR